MAAQVGAPAKRRRNAVVKVLEWLLAIVVIVLVAVAIFLAVFLRHGADGQTTFLGRPVYSVASGSMTPTFDTGDLIIDKPISAAAAEHLHKGQIITFRTASTGNGTAGLVITHRIYAVLSPLVAGVKTLEYQTKGDANNAPDQNLVSPTSILGGYQERIPFGGYVLSSLHQPITFVILIMIPVVYLVEEEIRRRWIVLGEQEAQRKRAEGNQQRELW